MGRLGTLRETARNPERAGGAPSGTAGDDCQAERGTDDSAGFRWDADWQ